MMSSVEELKVAFREDAQRYIDYCQQPDSAWNKYESPLWKKYFKDLNFTGAQVMDVGTGPGKLIDLLISIGASPDSLYAIEPNTIFWEIFKSLFPSIPLNINFGI